MVKIAHVTAVPPGRRVYRGLGGICLGKEWFCADERGVRSGVELGFLSTTVGHGWWAVMHLTVMHWPRWRRQWRGRCDTRRKYGALACVYFRTAKK